MVNYVNVYLAFCVVLQFALVCLLVIPVSDERKTIIQDDVVKDIADFAKGCYLGAVPMFLLALVWYLPPEEGLKAFNWKEFLAIALTLCWLGYASKTLNRWLIGLTALVSMPGA